MNHAEPLTFNGRPVRLQPTNLTMEEVTDAINGFRSILVVLEPGDGCKYQMFLSPQHGGRIQVAGVGGPAEGTVSFIVRDLVDLVEAARLTTGRDPWHAKFLGWWLGNLFHCLTDPACEGHRFIDDPTLP